MRKFKKPLNGTGTDGASPVSMCGSSSGYSCLESVLKMFQTNVKSCFSDVIGTATQSGRSLTLLFARNQVLNGVIVDEWNLNCRAIAALLLPASMIQMA